jgi:hypothetical protein
MDALRQRLARAWLARFAIRCHALLHARDAVRRRPREALRFLFRSRETSNFTYELANMEELAGMVAGALGQPRERVRACVAELETDTELRDELTTMLAANPKRDPEPRYGYRYIYYCAARLLRPGVIIEVGTHDGLGAAVLLRALERNEREGSPGKLVTLDATQASGWLIPERLQGRCTRLIGDLYETFEPALHEHGCDFLIDDIGHAFEGKSWLFESCLGNGTRPRAIGSEFPKRAPADTPTPLAEAVARFGGDYAEFDEDPRAHFWPGHTQALAGFQRSAT